MDPGNSQGTIDFSNDTVDSVSLSSCTFVAGKKFNTYAELEKEINTFKDQQCIELWKRNAKLISTESKKLERPLKAELVYYQLKYCCKEGGRKFKSESKGIRNTK